MRPFLLLLALHCSFAWGAPVPKPTDEEKLKIWGKVVDPTGDCKAGVIRDQLVLSTPGGIRNPLDKILRVEREIEGDFEVQVKMMHTTEPSHTAPKARTDARILSGLFVGKSDSMLIAFGRQLRADEEKGRKYFDHSIWLENHGAGTGSRIAGTKAFDEVFVRITRRGLKVSKAHSADGKEWHESAVARPDLPDRVHVGVYLWHDVDQPCEAVFERFRLTPLKAEK